MWGLSFNEGANILNREGGGAKSSSGLSSLHFTFRSSRSPRLYILLMINPSVQVSKTSYDVGENCPRDINVSLPFVFAPGPLQPCPREQCNVAGGISGYYTLNERFPCTNACQVHFLFLAFLDYCSL